MLRKSFLTALLLALIAVAGHAQGLVYEDDGQPLFEIEFPAGWLVDLDFADEARAAGTYTEGEDLAIRIVEANPGDGAEVWVGFWAIPDVGSLEEGLDYIAQLNNDLFTDLEISAPEAKKLNGMAARLMTATGKHEGQDVELILALFEPRAGTIAAALYVGAADIWRSYEGELRAMMATLEPAD